MSIPRPFPKYPSKLDSQGRLRIKIATRHYYLKKPLGSPASIAEYERLRLEHASGRLEPKLPERLGGLTVSELIAAWIGADQREPFDKETRAVCRACVPLERLFGATMAGEFTAVRLKAVQDAMATGSWAIGKVIGKRAGPDVNMRANNELVAIGEEESADWSREYINTQIGRICRLFRWAESSGHVPAGTWGHLRTLTPIRKRDPRVRSMPPRKAVDWATQVVPCLRFMSPVVATAVELIYLTGSRPCEILQMRRDEISQDGPEDTWLLHPGRHKNQHRGIELTKVFGERAKAILMPWYVAAGPTDYILPPSKMRYTRGFYLTEGLGRAVARACQRAGVTPWSPYQLRHACRLRVTRECGLDVARAVLGHSSMSMSVEYAKGVDVELAARAAKKIG